MSASMADLSIPLTAWAAGKVALLTPVQSSIFGAYPSAPAMADSETAISKPKKKTHVKYTPGYFHRVHYVNQDRHMGRRVQD